MFAKPQSEHAWLQPLVGGWSFEHDCTMPDGSTNKTSGKMQCRSLGGLWLICESSGGSDESNRWSSIMTVGFDPAKGHFSTRRDHDCATSIPGIFAVGDCTGLGGAPATYHGD